MVKQPTALLASLQTQGQAHSISDSPNDGELLRRFVANRDEAAFAGMVHRHGVMVLQTCHRVIGHAADAEDAFQATFLVLLRKANKVRTSESLAPWLHSVAHRCALAQRRKLARYRRRETALQSDVQVSREPATERDWIPYLDHEIERLPAMHRDAVVLCELQGKDRKEAAVLLGVAEGTLSSRLANARKKLAKRLSKRGLLSLAALGSWAAFHSPSHAAASDAFVQKTLSLTATGFTKASPSVSPAVEAIAQGAMKSMFLSKAKTLGFLLAGYCCLTTGIWYLGATEKPDIDSKTPTIVNPSQLSKSLDGETFDGKLLSGQWETTKNDGVKVTLEFLKENKMVVNYELKGQMVRLEGDYKLEKDQFTWSLVRISDGLKVERPLKIITLAEKEAILLDEKNERLMFKKLP
ncbi:MAG: sigma-70 family RNA polymerase sigma factor [Gemmatales bacterium]